MTIDRIDVGNRGIGSNSPIDRNADASKKDRSGGATAASTGEDSIALSARALKIDQLTDLAGSDRSQRMEQIKAAIENGTYEVSGEEIAQKMIDANKK